MRTKTRHCWVFVTSSSLGTSELELSYEGILLQRWTNCRCVPYSDLAVSPGVLFAV